MTTHRLKRQPAVIVQLHPLGGRAWRRAAGLMSLRDCADRYRERHGLPPLPADLYLLRRELVREVQA
ncbi:hypothetical protein [uncultured Thiohalocapsa sp.]|uniref:hypothetical protein n=1 Tax=uncultured Thiohalocapsa sp. TaxID=768990 RepID=UPI0025EA1F59|nr:hypothetical protein [uncultured Thiohalocapsa sp.]